MAHVKEKSPDSASIFHTTHLTMSRCTFDAIGQTLYAGCPFQSTGSIFSNLLLTALTKSSVGFSSQYLFTRIMKSSIFLIPPPRLFPPFGKDVFTPEIKPDTQITWLLCSALSSEARRKSPQVDLNE